MNSEDNEFVESLNCWEDNYDVITENIQKLSGMLSLQIKLLQNVQKEKEHEKNVRHMTLEEQSISRMLNSFEQRFNVELSKLTDFSNKLDTLLYNVDVLLTGQQVLVTRIAQIEEKLTKEEVTISSPISVKSEEGTNVDISKHLYELANKEHKAIPAVPNYRDVFKKNVATGDMLKIGVIDTHNRVVLDEPSEVTIKSPNLYRDSWCVKHSTEVDYFISVEPQGLMTITGEKAIQNEIVITRRGNTFTTGVITSDGKAVYYDQYL